MWNEPCEMNGVKCVLRDKCCVPTGLGWVLRVVSFRGFWLPRLPPNCCACYTTAKPREAAAKRRPGRQQLLQKAVVIASTTEVLRLTQNALCEYGRCVYNGCSRVMEESRFSNKGIGFGVNNCYVAVRNDDTQKLWAYSIFQPFVSRILAPRMRLCKRTNVCMRWHVCKCDLKVYLYINIVYSFWRFFGGYSRRTRNFAGPPNACWSASFCWTFRGWCGRPHPWMAPAERPGWQGAPWGSTRAPAGKVSRTSLMPLQFWARLLSTSVLGHLTRNSNRWMFNCRRHDSPKST